MRRVRAAQVAQVPVPGREPALVVCVVPVLPRLAQVAVSQRRGGGRGDGVVGQRLVQGAAAAGGGGA